MSERRLASPRTECRAGTNWIGCGLEQDHGGPHFSLRHEVFWMTPDEAVAMNAALWRLMPEVREKP